MGIIQLAHTRPMTGIGFQVTLGDASGMLVRYASSVRRDRAPVDSVPMFALLLPVAERQGYFEPSM